MCRLVEAREASPCARHAAEHGLNLNAVQLITTDLASLTATPTGPATPSAAATAGATAGAGAGAGAAAGLGMGPSGASRHNSGSSSAGAGDVRRRTASVTAGAPAGMFPLPFVRRTSAREATDDASLGFAERKDDVGSGLGAVTTGTVVSLPANLGGTSSPGLGAGGGAGASPGGAAGGVGAGVGGVGGVGGGGGEVGGTVYSHAKPTAVGAVAPPPTGVSQVPEMSVPFCRCCPSLTHSTSPNPQASSPLHTSTTATASSSGGGRSGAGAGGKGGRPRGASEVTTASWSDVSTFILSGCTCHTLSMEVLVVTPHDLRVCVCVCAPFSDTV